MIIEFNNISEEALTNLIRLDFIKIKLNNINYIKHEKNPYLHAKSFDVSVSNKPIVYGEHKLLCKLKFINKCAKILSKYVYSEIDLSDVETCRCNKTSNNILYLVEEVNTKKRKIVCRNCNLYFLDKLKKLSNKLDNLENIIKENNNYKYYYFDRDVFLSFVFDNFYKKGWVLGSEYNIIQESYIEFSNTNNKNKIMNKYNKYKEEIDKAKKYILSLNNKKPNDFITTLKILIKYKKFINSRDINTISYICKIYKESLSTYKSDWIGEVGQVIEGLTVQLITKPTSRHGEWGEYFIYNMKDNKDNLITCFSNKILNFGVGEKFNIDLKISDLNNCKYDKVKKTRIKLLKYGECYHD